MDPQQQNNGFGPLSKPRGKAALLAALIVVLISGAVHVKVTVAYASEEESKDKIHFLVFGTALLVLSVACGELVRRLCLMIEELRHKHTRYQGSWKKVFKSTFTFRYDRCILVVAVVSLLIVFHALYEHNKFYRSDYAILCSLNCFLVPQLLFLIGFRELSIVEVSQINEKENKNVADGLAWGYYLNYLKLVLPRLEEQIGKSSLDFRYKIRNKKLFILIPKTCFMPDKIEEADPRVKRVGNLVDYQVDRGGIFKRSYKHTVHRIEMPRPDGKIDEYHVILEYPTTLMSLYEMSRQPECGLSRQERDGQVVLFIRKLKEILDGCPSCRGKYELVPISGEREEIADVLVQMLQDASLDLDE